MLEGFPDATTSPLVAPTRLYLLVGLSALMSDEDLVGRLVGESCSGVVSSISHARYAQAVADKVVDLHVHELLTTGSVRLLV